MKRRLLAVLAALALTLSVAGVALATNYFTQSGCTSSVWSADTSRFTLFENDTSDTANGNDQFFGCSNIPDLRKFNSAGCSGHLGQVGFTWNDCASSISARVPSGYVFCAYSDANYALGVGWSGLTYYQVGSSGANRVNIIENVSSVRFMPGTTYQNCRTP